MDSVVQLRHSKPSILVVDDNFYNIMVIQEMAKAEGMTCYSAQNGQQAIDKVRECHSKCQRLDLIFMDCEMPLLSGLETTSILRKMMEDNEIPEIPIVGMSGLQEKDMLKKTKEAGMSEYILKPVTENTFKRLTKKYCC